MGTDCYATFDIKLLLAVGGHAHASRDTFMSDPRFNLKFCKCPLLRCNTKTVSVHRVLFLSEAKPLFKSPPLQPESAVSQFTGCCSLEDDMLPVTMTPVTFKGTHGRTRSTQVILLPVLHRHRSHHGPVHHIYRWSSDTLMSSQVRQATQHIYELIPRCTGTRTHDEAEWDHGQGPPEPTQEQIARVAEGHHRRRSQAQAPTQSLRLLNGQHVCRPGHTP